MSDACKDALTRLEGNETLGDARDMKDERERAEPLTEQEWGLIKIFGINDHGIERALAEIASLKAKLAEAHETCAALADDVSKRNREAALRENDAGNYEAANKHLGMWTGAQLVADAIRGSV